jgi:hypothetical protein
VTIAAKATITRLLLKKARSIATAVPHIAVSKEPVEVNISGNVSAAITAYGT